ncbi:MAG: quinone oxidoreductase [Alphaproteobacteria bacterium 64-11]|nr:quinone oxidoreductase [Alphaproteobacteria bacterium]OJU10906.1 MAG: quinone oxidoreductase [Alphaproteobacteria bacterium 64-11]
MTKAIRFEKPGSSEVLQYVDIDLPPPGAGEVRVRHTAIGVNFIDTYHRTGLYPLPLPSGLGSEAAGVVEAAGEGVARFKPGDRVGYASGFIGSYCEAANVPAARLVKIPDNVSDEIAAASLLKGMTAQYLLRRIHPVKAGETIVFHAAAGGVGQIGVQWARHLGATVIGSTTSPSKMDQCKANGCTYVLNTREPGWEKKVREITSGAGVPVVYDSIGKDTFLAGLDCLSPRGIMVTYGNASGPVDPFSPAILAQKGSLFVTRPTLAHYTRTPEELQETADDLFAVLASGGVKVAINQRFALKDAAKAQDELTAKKTTGATILIP